MSRRKVGLGFRVARFLGYILITLGLGLLTLGFFWWLGTHLAPWAALGILSVLCGGILTGASLEDER